MGVHEEARAADAHRARYGPPRYLIRAPGRVNLIGEHTDYNEGFVLPAAIDRSILVAAAPSGRPELRLYSLAYGEEVTLPTERSEDAPAPAWARYVQGVARELAGAGITLSGVTAAIGGDLPRGAGLSSSAAFEIAAALTLLAAAGAALDPRTLALLARRAEEEFVGVRCGIMDQFAVALARPGHALSLDCRTLEYAHVPMPASLVLLVCDTGVRRALADSGYNERRAECEQAVRSLQRLRPQVRALRDLGVDDLPLIEGLPEPLRGRARHVVTENQRVRDAVAAMHRGDGTALGRLLAASHASLRDDFAVSSRELDAMAAAAGAAPGCLGARLVGAGFGGSVLALVERGAVEAFLPAAASAYRAATGREGTFLLCEAVGGAEVTTRIRAETP